MKEHLSVCVALVLFGLWSTLVIAQQGNAAPSINPQKLTRPIEISAPDEAMRNGQYKEAVLTRLKQGETVSVPAEKIGALKGVVRLVSKESGTQPVAALSKATSGEQCWESCQTLCKVACQQTCYWDCRLFNGENVCTESCSTICPEVCNVTCRTTCK